MDKIFVNFLPPWVETNIQPAFYDKESGSVLQQTARMYAKVQCLVRMFNKLSKETQETVAEYIAKFVELKDFVDTYFENLDVQEEINNKIDAMAEDGSLASLFQYDEYTPFTAKNIHDLVYADSDTFQGGDHGSAQGSVVVGNSVIVALRNYLYNDDYVRLVEYDYTTNTIVREKYLLLEHANAMTYDSANGLIYVAGCAKVNSDNTGTDPSNTIFVLDYTTLSIQSSFVPTGLPEDGRVRSVTYDNEHHKLYAGDVTSIYEIDIATQAVVNTIELDVDGVDTTITNQTFTYLNNKFYGLFITYIAVWGMDGSLLKVLPFTDINEGKFGEPESITFKNNGDFIFVTAKRYNPRQSVRVTSLYKGNIYKGVDNILVTEVAGADTSNITIYVDADYTGEELGTSDKPFKDIAKAVAFAKSWNKGTDIKVASGTYNYVYLNQVRNVVIDATESGVVINGLELRSSDLTILHGSRITVNYLFITQESNFIASDITINQLQGSGNALKIQDGSTGSFNNVTINGNDTEDVVHIENNCMVSFRTPTLTGYTGHYAFYVSSFSRVCVYNPTLSIPASSTQKIYYVNAQSEVLCDAREAQSINAWQIQGQARKSPSILEVPLDSPVYTGDICDLHYGFTSAQIMLKIAGTNSSFMDFDIDLLEAETNGIRIDTTWPNAQGIRIGSVNIQVESRKLKITSPKMAFFASNGTYTFEDITTQTGQNYPAVVAVKFFNK